jgi:hypothetical protein
MDFGMPSSGMMRQLRGMKLRGWAGLLMVVAMGIACRSNPGQQETGIHPERPMRLLFIGNSFTYYHGGLENHVRLLAASVNPPIVVEAERATKGGATLSVMWNLAGVRERIREGRFDRVILQEDLPEYSGHDLTLFGEHVRRFDGEIRGAGAKTVLFMAWPYERLGWIGLEEIEREHRAVAGDLRLPVAWVGKAFRRAHEEWPALAMLGPDREHETIHGTYLAACVFHGVLFGRSPEGAVYRPAGVSADEAAFLQRIAWRTVRDSARTR